MKIKNALVVLLIIALPINSFAAVISDNDGVAFVTKGEFDALKNQFENEIVSYNKSIDDKIDGAIAQYIAAKSVANIYDCRTQDMFSYPFCFVNKGGYTGQYDINYRPRYLMRGVYVNGQYIGWAQFNLNELNPDDPANAGKINDNQKKVTFFDKSTNKLKYWRNNTRCTIVMGVVWSGCGTYVGTVGAMYDFHWNFNKIATCCNLPFWGTYNPTGTANVDWGWWYGTKKQYYETCYFDDCWYKTVDYWRTDDPTNIDLYLNTFYGDRAKYGWYAALYTEWWRTYSGTGLAGTYKGYQNKGGTQGLRSVESISIDGDGQVLDQLYQNNNQFIHTAYVKPTGEEYMVFGRKSEWGKVGNSWKSNSPIPEYYETGAAAPTKATIKQLHDIVDPGYIVTNKTLETSVDGYSSCKPNEITYDINDTLTNTNISVPLDGGLYLTSANYDGTLMLDLKLNPTSNVKTIIFGNSSLDSNIGTKDFIPNGTSTAVKTYNIPGATTNFSCTMEVTKGERIYLKLYSASEDIYVQEMPKCRIKESQG